METRILEHFLHLAKYQHVSQTADLLNISQPSLSKSIAQLENELGVKLFDRKGKHIVLNENGKQFAHYISQSLQLLDTAIFSAKSSRYDTLGTITIISYSYAGIITPCIAEYSRINPLANFIVVEPAEANETRRISSADFILSSARKHLLESKEEQYWVSQALFKENFILIMAEDFKELPTDKDAIDLADFREDPFVTMIQSNIFFKDFTYQACQNAGYFPKVYCQTDSFIVKMNMVRSGLAVALIPESCLPEARQLAPNLRAFHIAHHDTERTIYLMRRQQSIMADAAQDFWEFAMDYYHVKTL